MPDNPYQVTDIETGVGNVKLPYVFICAVLLCLSGVWINYLTAHHGPLAAMRSGTPPIHAIHVFGIVAVPTYLRMLIAFRSESSKARSLPIQIEAILIWIAFAVTWLPALGGNPYETFALNKRYFGSDTWPNWARPVILGIMPALFWSSMFRRSRIAVSIVCISAIGIHFHCAYIVWQLGHPSPSLQEPAIISWIGNEPV